MPERFSRTARLLGEEIMECLGRCGVAVFGLGGVGSFAAEGLARAGVGEFYLVDYDVVDITNINRQIHALTDTVGRPKTELMAERIGRINPKARVTAVQERYVPGEGCKLIPPELDYLVDAIDDVPAKVDLILNSLRMGIPVLSAMGAGNRLDPGKLRIADISSTSTCPLAKAVRKKLKDAGVEKGVKTVFSTEKPARPHIDAAVEARAGPLRRQVHGSVSFVPSVAGLLIAGEVVRDLAARGKRRYSC
ncbi:MAG TPA: tRNA threonylcarbamoyladenosine dehydratase [Bacillota bacterium]|nr:tRNA threonylcarbamoyladenosine dehydratase [Bacillota bacterium]